jgi:hypothetical protein
VDPLTVQSASRPGALRPAVDPQADLAVVLRQGRVLAGEVLATLDGGSLLIGVGGHRVPAKGNVRLQPGQRFLFEVQSEAGELVLAVLEEAREPELESRLLAALRSVAGGSGSLGRALADLLQVLRQSAGGESAGAQAAALHEEVSRHAFGPGGRDGDGKALASALARGGMGYEQRLGDAAIADLGPRGEAALGRELLEQLRARLGEGLAGFDPAPFEVALRAELKRALAAQGGAAELARGGLRTGLAPLLRAAIQKLELGEETRARLLLNLGRTLGDGLGRGLEGVLLGALLGAAAGPGGDRDALLAEAELDLKAHLLRAQAELADLPTRASVARVLEALENEQLLNVARARAGDALHFCLPVQDGERWAMAHLFVKPDADEPQAGAEGERTHRLALAVEFQHTGPLRAELAVRSASVAVRVSVSRPEVLELMRKHQGELEARLALGGRRVSLALGLAAEPAALLDRGLAEIRYLDEHHLLDRSC